MQTLITKSINSTRIPPSVLHIDDETSIQHSMPIFMYVSRITHTYPSIDPFSACIVDEWFELHRQFMLPFEVGADCNKLGLKESPIESNWLVEEHIPVYLNKLEVELQNLPHEAKNLGGLDVTSAADFCWRARLQWLELHFNVTFEKYPHVQKYASSSNSDSDNENSNYDSESDHKSPDEAQGQESDETQGLELGHI